MHLITYGLPSVGEEVLKYLREAIPQFKSAPLQVKVLHSKSSVRVQGIIRKMYLKYEK